MMSLFCVSSLWLRVVNGSDELTLPALVYKLSCNGGAVESARRRSASALVVVVGLARARPRNIHSVTIHRDWCHSCDVIALEAHVLLNPGKRLPVGIVRGVMCVEKCIVLRQPDSVCRMTVFVVCERSNVASMSVVVPV